MRQRRVEKYDSLGKKLWINTTFTHFRFATQNLLTRSDKKFATYSDLWNSQSMNEEHEIIHSDYTSTNCFTNTTNSKNDSKICAMQHFYPTYALNIACFYKSRIDFNHTSCTSRKEYTHSFAVWQPNLNKIKPTL